MKKFNEWINENFYNTKSFKIILVDQNGSVIDNLDVEVDSEDKYLNIIASDQQDFRAIGTFTIK